MEMYEKWNLTENEWNFLITFPFFVAKDVALADGFLNPEEYYPFSNLIYQASIKNDDWAFIDICKALQDLIDREVDLDEHTDKLLFDKDLFNQPDETFKRKEVICDHYKPIINYFDNENKEKILEFIGYLGFETAACYGIPDNPIDPNEDAILADYINWLSIDFNKLSNEKNKKSFFKALNLNS